MINRQALTSLSRSEENKVAEKHTAIYTIYSQYTMLICSAICELCLQIPVKDFFIASHTSESCSSAPYTAGTEPAAFCAAAGTPGGAEQHELLGELLFLMPTSGR